MNLYQLQEILAPPTLLQSVIGNPHVISQWLGASGTLFEFYCVDV
jgi:hypothetical protein